MKFNTTREVLDILLEGHKLTSDELDDFIATLPEDQHLDYKDGAVTGKQKREEAKLVVRQYVSGFANAEGGILVIGVSDQPRKVAPCKQIGRTPLDSWAGTLLQDMAPYLSPPPRIQAVEHRKGSVLVIAVARTPEFVPCVEARQWKYYLRLHDSTIEVPSFLITDLVLGRRQHPTIEVSCRCGQLPPHLEDRAGSPSLYFAAENLGFVTAEHLELGIVSWSIGEGAAQLNPHLSSYLDIGTQPQVDGVRWQLRHLTATLFSPEITRLTPFGRQGFRPIEGLRLPFIEGPVDVVAAVYLVSRGAPPLWFELQFTCSRAGGEVSRSSPPVVGDLKITRLVARRARVACVES